MSKRPFVLALSDVSDRQLEQLEPIPHTVVDCIDKLSMVHGSVDAILHWSGPRDLLREAFLAHPHLRWIHSRSAGLDSLLFPELVASEVPLTNGTGVFSQSLGEFALAAVLYFAKDFRRMIRNQEAGRWEPFDVEEVAGQTAGIVGYGDIGRAVASRLHAMGIRVLALKRHAPEFPDRSIDVFFKPAEILAMLAQCDYIVVAAPLTAETHHMIGEREIAAMKPHAVVINVGRGPVIDQQALVRALSSGRIKGAGLDVFEKEPIPANDPMYSLPNVLLSPHCADHTKDWLDQAMKFFLEQYERFRLGRELANVVDKKLGY